MHPRLDAIVLVPMFPHTLSSRPIVVDGNSEIKIVIGESNETYPHVSCDGQIHVTCAPGDSITITKKPQKLRLIHPINHNYYQTCRDKLGWASTLGTNYLHSGRTEKAIDWQGSVRRFERRDVREEL